MLDSLSKKVKGEGIYVITSKQRFIERFSFIAAIKSQNMVKGSKITPPILQMRQLRLRELRWSQNPNHKILMTPCLVSFLFTLVYTHTTRLLFHHSAALKCFKKYFEH